MKIKQAERVDQFVVLFSLSKSEGNVFNNEVTGQQCVQVFRQGSSVGNLQLLDNFLSGVSRISAVKEADNRLDSFGIGENRIKKAVLFILQNCVSGKEQTVHILWQTQ